MKVIAKVAVCVLIVFSLAAGVEAKPSIVVGTHYLNVNQAGQTIPIYVSGGDEVQGLEFNVCIGGGTQGPIFEDVDILTGTIFEGNNTGINPGSYINPRCAYQGTTTSSGTVVADGLLATLTIDTTGLFSGEYTLSLINTPEGKTNFAGVDVDIVDGLIVVPEPASLMILLVGSSLLIRRQRNRVRR